MDEVSYKLLQLFGPTLLKPQPERRAEMRGLAARHPRVADLLDAWEIMQVQIPELGSFEIFQHLHPLQQAGLLKVLEKSSSADAKLALAVIHQRHGDPRVVERLLAENHGAQGPLNMLTKMKEQVVAMTPQAAPDILNTAKKIFTDLKAPEPAKALAWRIAKSMAERRLVYDWLRKEVKHEQAFARQIGVMAEMARTLKVPAAELAEVEELDLKFNQDDPLVWVQRAISHAREGADEEAVNLFLEAVRRTSFATPPAYKWELAPPKPSWLARTAEAGRLADLAGALEDALKNNPPGSADDLAATLLETVIQGDSVTSRASFPLVKELLGLVLERHRHLLLASYDMLAKEAAAAEEAGEKEMATLLARMALRGVWPASMTKDSFHHQAGVNGVPSSVYHARAAWADMEPTLKPERQAPISDVLGLALRGDDLAAFSGELAQDAAQFPEDEQIISCALLSQARQGPLPVEALKLTDKLDPLARMRAAWRLCAHAPAQNLPRHELTPMLVAGVKEMFRGPKKTSEQNIRYRMAGKVIPWLAKNKATHELRVLTTLLLEHSDGNLWPRCWAVIADTASKHGSPEQAAEVNAKWWEHCYRAMNNSHPPVEWYVETMEDICLLVQDPQSATPEVFADMANDVWKTTLQKFAAGEDPPSRMARLLGDALIATGRVEQLRALQTNVENILLLDDSAEYKRVKQRLQEGLAMLDKDGGTLPSVPFWLEGGKTNEAGIAVAWHLAVPLKTSDRDWFITAYRPGIDDDWVVPHFLKGGHELEFHVGESPETLRPLTKAPPGLKAGTLPLQGLPNAGWLCAVLRSTGSGAVNFGKPMMYCLTKPLLDSTSLKRARPPHWDTEQLDLYGRPVSNLLPIERGLSIMITDLSEALNSGGDNTNGGTQEPHEVHLVGLDRTGAPVGVWALNRDKMALRPDGSRVSLVEPAQWTAAGGWLWPAQEDPAHDVKLTHLVMTTFGPPDAALKPLLLQAFARTEAPAMNMESKVLAGRPLADVGFRITGSYLSETMPRAAFTGQGALVVYDTASMPWKELLRFKDAAISEDAGIFMMGPDKVCLINIPSKNQRTSREIWQLRCDGGSNPVTLLECPKASIPFVPARRERSPNELSHIFIAAPEKAQMQVAWLDSMHAMTTISIPAASVAPAFPLIAWWADNQTAVIEQGGNLQQIQYKAGDLKLTFAEKGSLARNKPPQGGMPGRQTHSSIWVLKRPQVMVRAVKRTGEILSAHRLPEECVGAPMAWLTPERPVLLQTSQHELISVRPEISKP